MSVKISLTAPQFVQSAAPVLEAARFVEESGLHGIFLFDHLVPLDDPQRPVLELASTLGAVAAVTSRILVGTLVMRAPLRGPEISAAIARTAAMISPGRLVVGIGSGDSMSADEADRYGNAHGSMPDRIEAVIETIELLEGSGITRWVGGAHERLLDAARQAEGWNGWAYRPEQVARIAARLGRPQLEITWGGPVVVGRNQSDLDAVLASRGGRGGAITGTPDAAIAQFRALAGAGVQHFVVSVLPNTPERWEIFARSVAVELAGTSP